MTLNPVFISSIFVILFSSAHCIVSEGVDEACSPYELSLRDAVDGQSDAQQVVPTDHLQQVWTNSSEETNVQIPSQLRLRTVFSTSFSRVVGPIVLLGASTLFHATLFRGLFPSLFNALKSSELGNVDLSPDAVSRNVADFIMDYVCEVLSALAQMPPYTFVLCRRPTD